MTEAAVQTGNCFVWSFPSEGDSAFVVRREEGQPIGWLRFEPHGSGLSTAEWEGRRWTFERTGPPHSAITIRAEGADEPAIFTLWRNGGGSLTLPSGAHYCWNRKHILSTTWCFRSEQNQSAVCVNQHTGPLVAGGTVTMCCKSAQSPDMPLLVLLAWYLRILEFQRLTDSLFVCG